ncbi:glycosyltransferase [Nocardioides rotundus]|uniref:glycosyltransferase n=1 Tax=Nocardioides rotundus TaxID=1774216 RepID=UPI001CBC9BC0|nr:glycosyltransferase [Nocardioides rotundus]UAL29421.1 glycosyltransferase [Nocardioides rotundus]
MVVPARDEEELLPGCLDSMARAVEQLDMRHPGVHCTVTVVLDGCTDRSADAVGHRPWESALEADVRRVGAARAIGVLEAEQRLGQHDPAGVWVANTDADTRVPPHWLTEQVRLAALGHGLVVGTVRPDPADLTEAELARWQAGHRLVEGHRHVHGANLGFSLAAYRRVGGFPPVTAHEDVALVAAMRAAGVPWCATTRTEVTTSGRRWSRVEDGFARRLRTLASTPE